MISPRVIFNVICALLIAAFAYGLYSAGHDKAKLEGQLKEQQARAERFRAAMQEAQENLRQVNVANEQNAQRAREDQLVIERLQESANETPANVGRCLDADAARRVRDIR